MSAPNDKPPAESQTEHVTYVVVVHGIGEQRKNECVINVVNRFAEGRRNAEADDNRDVLTLGKASSQTGWSKAPVTGQPWLEFDGIPASPNAPAPDKPFLGEPAACGQNLRFVDLCWSDVMQDSIEHVGQDVDLWAKGLVGRLLRKHEAAEKAAKKAETEEETQAAEAAKVPLWIRRVLYLLADTLLLVRFAMNFRFKEMKELVFVKFLGDVQLYGEYDRCRGQAVRRFHELMAKVEATHYAREPDRCNPRSPRYVIIAHSLGSIMSLDALLYASATPAVRLGRRKHQWTFPGYLQDGGKLAPPDTGWIRRVESFVTLGSPIDKYLAIWWMNYRYLLKSEDLLKPNQPRIHHFNYCDELDPVGHKLDVVQQTPVYDSIFDGKEDVVFNRYFVPGMAHNKYWTDQRLFRWILARAVDANDGVKQPPSLWQRVRSKLPSVPEWMTSSEQGDEDPTAAGPGSPVQLSDEAANEQDSRDAERPRWFRRRAYVMLLLSLYSLVPALVLVGTYGLLTLAFQADGWRTAILAAVGSAFFARFGRRLIDLTIWWRQIQRHESGSRCDDPQRSTRRRAAWLVRSLVATVPFAWATLTAEALRTLTTQGLQDDSPTNWAGSCCVSLPADDPARPLLVVAVVAVVGGLLMFHRLPAAYRTPAFEGRSFWPKTESALLVVVYLVTLATVAYVATQVVAGPDPITLASTKLQMPGVRVGQLALLGIVATAVYSYRLYRFLAVKCMLHPGRPEEINYGAYAGDPPGATDT